MVLNGPILTYPNLLLGRLLLNCLVCNYTLSPFLRSNPLNTFLYIFVLTLLNYESHYIAI